MKAFILMIGTALMFHFLLGEESQPAPTGETLGAVMQSHVDKVSTIAKEVDWICNTYPFSYVVDHLNIEIHWDTVDIIEQGAFAFAIDREVHMQIGVCHPAVIEVFFHEVGHILMGHCSNRQNISYSDIMEEEANYLSMYIMNELGLEPFDRRFRKLINH